MHVRVQAPVPLLLMVLAVIIASLNVASGSSSNNPSAANPKKDDGSIGVGSVGDSLSPLLPLIWGGDYDGAEDLHTKNVFTPRLQDALQSSFTRFLKRQRSRTDLVLTYGIFRGQSSLRRVRNYLAAERAEPEDNGTRDVIREILLSVNGESKTLLSLAMLLLLSEVEGRTGKEEGDGGNICGDVAHEVLLGVNLDNVEEAEYAATHPGETNWSKQHPLSDVDDMAHSLIHRLEGNRRGEGNHTGYENAKYWIAGGPKLNPTIPPPIMTDAGDANLNGTVPSRTRTKPVGRYNPVPWRLAKFARRRAPTAAKLGVVAPGAERREGSSLSARDDDDDSEDNIMPGHDDDVQHDVIAGGGRRRTVRVRRGCWDAIRFIDLVRMCYSPPRVSVKDDSEKMIPCSDDDFEALREELQLLQAEELRLLLRYEMLRLSGLSDDEICLRFGADFDPNTY